MSHYSDIGFKVKKPKDVNKMAKLIYSEKLPLSFSSWDIKDNPNNNLILRKYSNFRLFAKGNLENRTIDDFFMVYDNPRISKCKSITVEEVNDGKYFPLLLIEKDSIPFWFTCFNADIFWFEGKDDGTDIKIVGFANSIEIKDAEDGKGSTTGQYRFADESYMQNLEGDKEIAFVSGIIKSWALETNPFTKKKFYCIDIDCLGLYFKMLVDPILVKKKELKVGKVLCGEFWNTAVLVADNHPDYF